MAQRPPDRPDAPAPGTGPAPADLPGETTGALSTAAAAPGAGGRTRTGARQPDPPGPGSHPAGTTAVLAAEPAPDSAGDALSRYLHAQATEFLRALAQRAETGHLEDGAEPARLLRRSARRLNAALHTYGPLTDPAWSEPLRAELGWLSTTLAREPAYTARLARLLTALGHLAATEPYEPEQGGADAPRSATGGRADGAAPPGNEPYAFRTAETDGRERDRAGGTRRAGPGPAPAAGGAGPLAMGAARAGALLDRQLTLARTRAHSATLRAFGSSRFHALADAVAVLASEVPLTPAAEAPAGTALRPLAARARDRLTEAANALPLARAGYAYNADALRSALSAEATTGLQDAPWHHVRVLLRRNRYALEVCPDPYEGADPVQLATAGRVLQRHHEASKAAAAVDAAARTPRIAPATAYALGMLHADQRHDVEAARFAFGRLWR